MSIKEHLTSIIEIISSNRSGLSLSLSFAEWGTQLDEAGAHLIALVAGNQREGEAP